jgi:hypothetical protein
MANRYLFAAHRSRWGNRWLAIIRLASSGNAHPEEERFNYFSVQCPLGLQQARLCEPLITLPGSPCAFAGTGGRKERLTREL